MDIRIRPLEIKDAETSVAWRNDPQVFKYTGNTYNHIITLESELNWIRRVIQTPNDYRCAILVDGIYVGNVYLTDIENGRAHYHIFIGDRRYWGKGVARSASVQIIQYGFEVLKLDVIQLKVNNANVRAKNLYTSLGFVAINEEDCWVTMEIRSDNANNERIQI